VVVVVVVGWIQALTFNVNSSLQPNMKFDGSQGDVGTELGHWYGNDGCQSNFPTTSPIFPPSSFPHQPYLLSTHPFTNPPLLAQLFAFNYWHNELGFSGNGGSAKIYPAHGTMFLCAAGSFNLVIEFPQSGGKGQGGSDTLYGNGKNFYPDPDGWKGPCKCYGNTRWDIFGSDIRVEYRK
jgi:hypothetical protein